MDYKLLIILLLASFLLVSCGAVMQARPKAQTDFAPINRYKEDIDRFAQQDQVNRHHPELAVFTGSSSIKLWESLPADMAPYPVLNRGFGGSTLREANHYFDQIAGKYKPSQLFLYCGENDLAEGASVQQTYDRLVTFLNRCASDLPSTQVIYLSIKPSPTNWSLRKKFAKLNTKVQSLSNNQASLQYLDITEVMLLPDGTPDPSLFLEDQLHMNSSGYARWSEVVKPTLSRLRSIQP